MKALALPLVAVLLMTGCGGDDDLLVEPQATNSPEVAEPTYVSPAPGTPTVPTPTAPAPSITPTTPAPDPSEFEGPVVSGAPTPEAAAKGFHDRWVAGDSEGAIAFATVPAINQLFAYPSGNPLEYMGCEEEGSKFRCFYYYEGGGLNMVVRDSDAGGWLVTRAFFVVD